MRRRRSALITAFVAGALLVPVACGGRGGLDDGVGTLPDGSIVRPDSTAAFGWTEFGEENDDDGVVQLGAITVPVAYDDPSAGIFELYVARHLATDPERRIGSLLINPGGPGYAGSDFAIYASLNFTKEVLARFDIVGWDPRGTGLSTPSIDCFDDYDRVFATQDVTPDDEAERAFAVQLAQEVAAGCSSENADILTRVGTNDSARDIDTIREALGEETITYLGYSYGSELGATWATLFPGTVRAAVLDGAVDPNAGLLESGIDQAAGFESAVATFLSRCSADDDCAFHNDGDAEGAFDRLMRQLDEHPMPTEPGRPDVNLAVALNGVGWGMYSQQLWRQLESALADAQGGDARGLLAMHDAYFQRTEDGTFPNTLEAFQVITCMDRSERPTVAEEDAAAAQRRAVAPRMSPATVGAYMCTFFPPAPDPRIPITGAGAGPIVVVGTTGDPATPLAGSQAMAHALEGGVLLTVVGDEHTGYGLNDCSIRVVDAYLVDLEVPAEGTRCE